MRRQAKRQPVYKRISSPQLRACSHGGGGPREGEVPHLGGVTDLSIQSLFLSWSRSHEKWGTPLRWVARSAGPGNRLSWGEFSPCESRRWGNSPSWGDVHLGIYQHSCQPLQAWRAFPTISSKNVEKNSFSEENTEEVDGASDFSVESDNKADLLKYLKEDKVTCSYNEKNFEQDLSAMYRDTPMLSD